jgi:hypothetical protein
VRSGYAPILARAAEGGRQIDGAAASLRGWSALSHDRWHSCFVAFVSFVVDPITDAA